MWKTVLAWLRLVRLSGMVTLLSNALAACAVVFASGGDIRHFAAHVYQHGQNALWVACASICLYASGMIWNDVFDIDRDRDLYPHRPLVSGKLSPVSVFLGGIIITLLALFCAGQIGYRGFYAAGIIVAFSFCYNGFAKHIPFIGALCMGAVRFTHAIFVLLMLDVDFFDFMVLSCLFMGSEADVQQYGSQILAPFYPFMLFLYICGLTYLSELESRRGTRLEVLLGTGLFSIPLFAALYAILFSSPWIQAFIGEERWGSAILGICFLSALLLALGVRIGGPLVNLIKQAKHELVGPVIGRGLAGIILFDAIWVSLYMPALGCVLLLLIPVFAGLRLLARME